MGIAEFCNSRKIRGPITPDLLNKFDPTDVERKFVSAMISAGYEVYPGRPIYSPDPKLSNGKQVTIPDFVVKSENGDDVHVEVGARTRRREKIDQRLVAKAAGVAYVQINEMTIDNLTALTHQQVQCFLYNLILARAQGLDEQD